MHTVPFKLNDNAHEFQAGEYTGFGIRTGVKYQDRNKQDQWTNYKAAIFAKSPAQIDFYRANLIKGALVVVTSEKQEVEIFTKQSGETIAAIKLINPNVVAVKTDRAPDAAQQAYNKGQQQDYRGHAGSNQPNPTTTPAQQAPSGFDSFDDDIPF
jgi:single-strand DNA-binding protein